MHKTIKFGYRYTVKPESIYWDNEKRFKFAEPVDYADGSLTGDCWIVDRDGIVHPGYNVSPIPLNIASLRDPKKIEA